MATLVFALGLALGVSFLCSLMEAALLSLTQSDIGALSGRDARAAAIWHGFKRNIGLPISVILLLNTSAHTVGASLAGAKFTELWGDNYLWLFSLIFTFLMLQYTEILPKTLGVRFRMGIAMILARPLAWSVTVLRPILRLIHAINRPFAMEGGREGEGMNTIQEIAALVAMARMENQIGTRQERIILSAAQLSGVTARQVMIPVEQVMFLSTDNTIQEAFLMAHVDLHTRYPVRRGDDLTTIVGYVNFKELVYFMSTNPNNPSLSGIIRPLTFVEPDTSATDLLRLFVDQHNHMVVVREEDGPAMGIVTIEDVIEEMVGEIEDEFDRLPLYIHSLAGGIHMAGGGAKMGEVEKRVGICFDQPEQSIDEWLLTKLARQPQRGDAVRYGGYEFSVRRIKRGRVFDAVITSLGPIQDGSLVED